MLTVADGSTTADAGESTLRRRRGWKRRGRRAQLRQGSTRRVAIRYDGAPFSRVIIMAQYVYTMQRVGKVVPPKRQILKNISLSFFPGAKIGVLGLNGSGKSSLLKIMAGVDKNFCTANSAFKVYKTNL